MNCSNTITREQAAKAARLAYEIGGGIVTIFLDNDAEGEKGMKHALGYLAQLEAVRLAWTGDMHGGRLRGRRPESLTAAEWAEIAGFLTRHVPSVAIEASAIPEVDERQNPPIIEPDMFYSI